MLFRELRKIHLVIATLLIVVIFLFRWVLLDSLNTKNVAIEGSNDFKSKITNSRKGKANERNETYAEVLKKQEEDALESVKKQFLQADSEGKSGPYQYRLFASGDGRLTTGASEAAKLTEDERDAVGILVKRAWKKAGESFASRAKLDASSSDDQKGLYIYEVPASHDRGKGLLDELREGIAKAVGKQKQDTLTKGVEDNDCFGGFGSVDVRVEFDVSNRTYKYKYTNPETGRTTSEGEASMEHSQELFGEAFKFSW